MAGPVWCCWPGYWRLHLLSVLLSRVLVNLPSVATQLEQPIVSGCLYLSSFLSFCANTDLGGWNKGACVLFPPLEFCGLPDQAKEHTWSWMGCVEQCWGKEMEGEWKRGIDIGWELRYQQLHSKCGATTVFPYLHPRTRSWRHLPDPHHLLQRNLR